MKIVDADGHVAEGASLAVQAMERWPQFIKTRTDGRPSLKIEGRHYPEDQGPGAGCPPEHGLSTVRASTRRRPKACCADADRDGIDTWCSSRASACCAPSIEDRRVRRRLRPPLQRVDRRLVRAGQRAACTASPSRRSSTADDAIDDHARGEEARPGRGDDAAGAEDAQSRSPRSRRVLRRRRRARHAARHPRRARHPPAEDRRRPLRQLHPGALRQLPVRPDGGDDRAGVAAASSTAIPSCASPSSKPASAGCRTSSIACTSTSRSAATGSRTAGSAIRSEYVEAGNIWVSCEPEEPILPARGRRPRRRLHHVRQRLPALGRRLAGEHQAPALARRHQRGGARQDRRRQRAEIL